MAAGNRACRRKHKQWWEYKKLRKARGSEEYKTLIYCPICAGTAGKLPAQTMKETRPANA